jgi:NADPH:quinone reductase-like Zn-dependent oxidoreductase
MTTRTRGDAPTLTGTMPAWRQHRYGDPEVVALEEAAIPAPGSGEVLLRVRATALNNGDVRVLRGEPRLVRLVFGLRHPKQPVRGMDVAATVVARGEGVAEFSVGDEIVVELPGGGGLAAYAIAPVKRLVRRPAGLAPAVAAALPIAAGTAWQALDRARVVASQRVLVIGASGGVGHFAVQLAALRGAEVWALSGEHNRRLAESLGAVRTFDYRRVQPGSPELPDGSFDAVIDIAGTAPLRALQRLVRDGGAVALVSGEGGRVLGPIGRLAAASARSLFSRRRLRPVAAVANRDILAELVALAEAGRIRPVIERTYAFGEGAAALAHVAAGHTAGKVVVLAG